jgi:natural product biosynthesis luciferase-like monooxygenase protein/amino acid adenylation domain-containing protein
MSNQAEGYRISPIQRRVWVLTSVAACTDYSVRARVWLEGVLDRRLLQRALEAAAQGHEALRTTLHLLPGMSIPVQVVGDHSRIEIEEEEWSEPNCNAVRSSSDAVTGLQAGSVLGVKLSKLNDQRHRLSVSAPAVCADVRSLQLVVAEAVSLYNAWASGADPSPVSPLQYPDVSEWLNEMCVARETAAGQRYWKQVGAEIGADLLSVGKGNLPVGTGVDGDLYIKLASDTERKIIDGAVNGRWNIPDFFLAAWATVLERLGYSADWIAVSRDGRSDERLLGAVGPLTRYLPVRLEMDRGLSFENATKKAGSALAKAQKWQECFAWEFLEEERETAAKPSHMLFGLDFVDAAEVCRGAHLTAIMDEAESCLDRFGMKLTCGNYEAGRRLRLHWLSDHFTEQEATLIAESMAVVLADAVERPEKPIQELNLVDASGRRTLLEENNRTWADFAGFPLIHEQFSIRAAETPEAIAVQYEGKTLIYAELEQRTNRLADALRRRGVGPDRLVGIYLERSLEMVVALLGVLKAGGAYVPLDPGYPADRLDYMVSASGATVVLSSAALAGRVGPIQARVENVEDLEREEAILEPKGAASKVDGANLAYVIYTSGSTGAPKGVMITHDCIRNHMAWMRREFPLSASDRVLQKTAFSFDASVWEFYAPLLSGGALVMAQPGGQADAEYLVNAVQQNGITVLQLVPTQLRMMLERQELDRCTSLKRLYCGGEVLTQDLVQKLHQRLPQVQVYNLYGPTEATIDATCEQCSTDSLTPTALIGRPVANTQVYVLDHEMRLAPIGVKGELYIGGAGVGRGYLKRPELTSERFVPNPFSENGERLYRTGDQVRWLCEGKLEFFGRLDQQVKVRGYRIELGEIEAVLESHATIRQAAVVALGEDSGDKRLVAYVVVNDPDAELRMEEVQHHLGEKLPDYMVPGAVIQIEELPLTPNGKVDRRALAALKGTETVRSYVGPRDAVEEILCGIFAEVLKRERVGIEDNFFELGGHSLIATQLVSRVRSILETELTLRALFESPTVASLAQHIAKVRGAGQKRAPHLLPADRARDLPLSYGQQRLWFINQFEPGDAAYNLSFGLRLGGLLNRPALQWSVQTIVNRHESLRTTFPAKDGAPVQRIAPELEVAIEEVDLRGTPPDRLDTEVRKVARKAAAQTFDLEQGPLIRVKLLQLSEQEHVILVMMHHIITDLWSSRIMARELTQLYEVSAKGLESPLPDMKAQYADFAVWQREWLQGEVLQEQLGYWRQQLAGAPALELPADHPRPPVMSHRGGMAPVDLPAALTQQLKEVSRQAGVTVFMSLQTAFLTMLGKYAGQEDVSIGTAVANRDLIEIEGVIGFFVNTVVLRNDLSGNPSFRELLGRVRKTVLEAHEHQHVPFEKLVEELQPDRDLSRTPLFQVMLLMHDQPGGEFRLAGLHVSDFPFATNLTNFDLTLEAVESSAGITGVLSYARDLYERKSADRMAAHLRAILETMVKNPDQRIGDLSLLTEAERRQVLVDWNRTGTEYPQKTVHELFEEQAESTPQNVAVVCEDLQLTFAQLNRQANQLAHHLCRLGVTRGALVGLCVERSIEMMIGLLGILKSGAAYVPLEPGYPAERLQFMMQDSAIGILLTQERLLGVVPEVSTRVVCLDADWEEIAMESEENPAITLSVEDLAYAIYTSGSTGKPKGVGIAHRNVVNFFEGMDQSIGCGVQDTLLAVTGISFDISVLELFWTLTRGARVVLVVDPLSSAQPLARPVASGKVDYSLFYFSSADKQQTRDKYRLLLEGAAYADRNGLAAVWTPERHFHQLGGLYPNPSVTSAAVAAVTERIAVRAGSVVLPLHNVIRVAEEWSVVDNISGGRAGLAFASGWHSDDFALAPENYPGRRDAMFRSIEIFLKLWRGESVKVQNGTGNEIEVHLYPRPIQERPPIWITAAGSPDTFVRAGLLGAHVLTHLVGQTIEEVTERIRAYRAARAEGGHDPETGQVALMLHTFIGDDKEKVRDLVRAPFTEYLKSSVDLLRNMARGMNLPADMKQISERDMEDLLALAFDRYFETSALFGTVKSCAATIERLQEIGVNEAACLIDFGVPDDAVLGGLRKIGSLKKTFERYSAVHTHTRSVGMLAMEYKPTLMQCTPAMMRMLGETAEGWAALKCLRTLMLGGESLPPALAQEIKSALPCKLVNMYGPTETTIWSSTAEVGRGVRTVSVGRPIANTEFYIVDRYGQPVAPRSVGELWIGGDGIARGYLNRPELTAERFVPDAFSGRSGSRLYRTGDLARYGEDGRVELLGRNDAQVKIRGHRIELGEIESLLERHPAVKAAVVVAREDGTGGNHLAAYIVEQESGSTNSSDLRRYVKESLPEYMVPARFVMLAELPFTPNGKVDRGALPVAGKEGLDETRAYVPPGTPTEEELARIWADVLRVERVGIHDNFFELGGHSLTATLVISRVRSALQVDLPLRTLFEEPTIAGFNRKIDEQRSLAELGGDLAAVSPVQQELTLEQVLAGLEPSGERS